MGGVLRSVLKHLGRIRQATLEDLLPSDSFVCQLRTTVDVAPTLVAINQYNRLRSMEAGGLIRDSNRVLLFRYLLDSVKDLDEGDYAEVGRGMIKRCGNG